MARIKDFDKCWWGHLIRGTYSLLIVMQNCTVTLEDNFEISYRTKYSLTVHFSKHVNDITQKIYSEVFITA